MRKVYLMLVLFSLASFSLLKLSFSQTLAPVSVDWTYRGDINEDGRVNILDLLELLKLLGSAPENDCQREIANVDKSEDGRVNIFDLLGMLRILGGSQRPEIIYWGPAITGMSSTVADIGDTLDIYVENFDQTVTAADIKVYLDSEEVALLEFGLENLRIIIPEWFKGGELTLSVGADTTNSVHLSRDVTLVPVPAGTFQMGNEGAYEREKPVHSVTLDAFRMSATEITNAQYAAYLNSALADSEITVISSSVKGAAGEYRGEIYLELFGSFDSNNKCWIRFYSGRFSAEPGREDWPVVYVSWYGAKAFARKSGMDLPTEAEWEYAARGGQQYGYGTDNGKLNDSKANYRWKIGHPTDAGSYPANPFGLYDLAGNVWEWCNDWYDADYYSSSPSHNPGGPQSGFYRVFRGGSWSVFDYFCFSANRDAYYPDSWSANIGFRVVRR
ncbi:MAG TPA: formylglycine-generating enzyme family protein [archaeon]|nr:formylglycine-generating enzyme family protein [archaeon]